MIVVRAASGAPLMSLASAPLRGSRIQSSGTKERNLEATVVDAIEQTEGSHFKVVTDHHVLCSLYRSDALPVRRFTGRFTANAAVQHAATGEARFHQRNVGAAREEKRAGLAFL